MKKRLDLEVIRIIAIIFVIINHTATNSYICEDIYNSGFAYYIYLFTASLARVAVPLFFMVSGILLIPKEETIKTIIKKRVLKYVAIIIGVSVYQYLFAIYNNVIAFSIDSIVDFATKMYVDSVAIPYWFLYAYLSLLIMLPFLRKLVKNMTDTDFKYLIGLHIVFFTLCQIFEYFAGLDRINLSLPLACETSYFYFILGYYLDNHIKLKKQPKYLYIISVLSVIFSTFMVYWQIATENVFASGSDYKYSSALIIFPTVSIFFLCKNYCNFSNKFIKKIVSFAGGASFGLYLFESVFEQATFDIYFIAKRFLPPIISWLIWVCIVVTIATIIISIYHFIVKLIRNTFRKLQQK